MRRILLGLLVLGWGASGVAQDAGNWRAASENARTITGDVYLTGGKVTINFAPFTIAEIRSLQPAELGAVFDAAADGPGSGRLYRVAIPAAKRFLHKNSLCGGEDAQWMLSYVSGHNLQLAFFSGSTAPVLSTEAMANGSEICGVFGYVK